MQCDAFIATVESETETETRNSGKKRQARFFPSDAAEGVQPGGSYNRIAHRGLRMQRGWEVSDRWDGLRWVSDGWQICSEGTQIVSEGSQMSGMVSNGEVLGLGLGFA